MILNPNQQVTALNADLDSRSEQSSVVCLADAGAREVSSITAVPDVAGNLNSTYFTLTAQTTNYYVWFNINSAGVDPAVGGKTGIEVAGATGVTAAVLGAAIRVAVAAAISTKGTVTGTGSQCIVTNTLMGNITNVADGAAATGFTFATTAGVASSLQNKYFLLNSPSTAYAVWLNVNGEGVDPAVSLKTMIPVAVAAGASAATIAAAISAAVEAIDGLESEVRDGVLRVGNTVEGTATDIGAGNSGFTVTVLKQGLASLDDASGSPGTISNDPSTL